MKIQFGDGRIRVRLSGAEFDGLRDGQVLRTSVRWPGGGWSCALRAGDAFVAHGEATGMSVTLPRAELDALAARLPSKDGLRHPIDGPAGAVELDVEVDLHDGRRHTR